MQINTVPSRNAHQDVSAIHATQLSSSVMMTGRGQSVQALHSLHEYEKTPVQQPSITELLSMSATDDIIFEPPKLSALYQPVAF